MSSLQNHSLLLALADRDKLIEDLKQTLTGITSPKSPSSPLPPSSPSNNSVLDSLLVKELNSQLRLLREEKNSIQCYLYDQSEHLAEFKRLTQQQHSTIHSMESELEELKQQLADHKTLADHLQKVSLQSAERHQSDKQLIGELEQSVRQISWEAQTKLTEMEAEQKKEYLQLSMRHKADCKALVDSHRRFIKRLEEELHALNIQRNQNNNNDDDDDEPVEQSILKCISTIVHDFNVER
jgi:hypothetical protein